jgi:Fe-S-cluster containining protein
MATDLNALLDELTSDVAYASGRRPFPRTISNEDAMAIADFVHEEVDRGTEARAQAAASDGIKIACGRGCKRCCSELLLVYEQEALVVATWLRQPENAAVLARFLERYPRWHAAVGDAPERLQALVEAGDKAAYNAAHVAQTRAGVLCAFNDDDGACSIHPARPVACRNGHAVDTPDYCGADHPSGRPAVRLAYKPLDDFLARVRQLDRATHNALGKPVWRPESVCVAVYRLLQR